RAVYSEVEGKLVSLKINGQPVEEEKNYRVCLQGYHVKNCQAYLNISEKELRASGQAKTVATSAQQVLEEWLRGHQNRDVKIDDRLVYKKN
ncbi:bifunctional metallophosphatase/5'-nucleotidase, partial [Patescibacteria group bacterium]|nr:bifunctional metallophosphatase/5'-nucleotidase [Patescibacteria group bacterium]